MSIITLTSDIGMQDYLVGAIKGQLWQICPECHVTDITHHISPFNLPQATYICKSAFSYFPLGTFHFVLINLFDKRPDHILVAEHNGQYIGCADNGLLTMIAGGMPENVIKIPLPPDAPKNTFTIIQLTATAAREMSKGKALGELGPLTQQIQIKHNLQPLVGDDFIEGQIIHIDSFENVVVNITKQQFIQQCKNRRFRILFRRNEVISQISETYADVPEGTKLALFNAAGYLEIAINKGNAAGLFGLQGFKREQLTQPTGFQQLSYYQTVRIIFQ